MKRINNKGFSLLEVLIAVGLLSLVSLGFMAMMDNVVRFQRGAQAKDQQKEVSSRIRALLSRDPACNNTMGGQNPTGAGFTLNQIRDSSNVVRMSTTVGVPENIDGSNLLQYISFRVNGYDALSNSATMTVTLRKTGSTTGTVDIVDRIFLHMRLDGANNILYCIALGKQTDSFWTMTPGNSADISFGLPFVGRVGIGTNAPPTKLAVNGDGLFTSSVAVNTTTPATVGTHALIVTGNSMFAGNVNVNTTTPVVATPLLIAGNARLVGGGMGLNTSTPVVNESLVVAGNTRLVGGNLGVNTSTPVVNESLVVAGNTRLVGGNLGVGTSTPVAGNNLVVVGTTYVTGNMGVGTATPSERLVVMGNAQADMFLFNSDQRLKTNIEKAPGIEQIRRLHGHSFNWIKDGRFDTGLIAQEIEQEMPHLVRTSPQGMKSVNYMGLVPVLVEGSKDLYAEHIKLLKRVEELEKAMKAMKKRRPASSEDDYSN